MSIDHGIVDFTNTETTYGQSVAVSCETGYKLTGGTSIQCLSDGTWSTHTTCEMIGMEIKLYFSVLKQLPSILKL